MMRLYLALASALALSVPTGAAACAICDSSVRLDQARAACLLARYDAFAKQTRDPIMVDLSKCDGVGKADGSRGPDQTLGPKQKPMSTVIILQRQTLDCLSARLRGLPKDTRWPAEFALA